jgi:hypothetical protein
MLVPDRQNLYNSLMMRFTNINSALPGAAWKNSDFPTKAALLGRMYEREVTRNAQNAAAASDPNMAAIMSVLNIIAPSAPAPGQPVRKDPALGVKSPIFGGDAKFLEVAAIGTGFGRMEFSGDDGAWMVNGRLSDAGKAALKAMEANGVFAQLINPGEALLGDFLNAAEKPFLVTGMAALPAASKALAVSKKIVWGIDCDPEDLEAGLERADQAKKAFGAATNLVVVVKSTDRLSDLAFKRAFYFGLIKRGWTADEISAFVGGSLRGLSPAAVFGGTR